MTTQICFKMCSPTVKNSISLYGFLLLGLLDSLVVYLFIYLFIIIIIIIIIIIFLFFQFMLEFDV